MDIVNWAGLESSIVRPSPACTTFTATTGYNCKDDSWINEVDNAPGFKIYKKVDKVRVEPGDPFSYTLEWASIGMNLSGLRLVEILPYDLDANTPQTNFTGTLVLSNLLNPVSYSSGSDPAVEIYYTRKTDRTTIAQDPYDGSHILTGLGSNSASQTIWCTPAQFNTGDCPTQTSEVTAIFFAHPTDTTTGVLYSVGVPVTPANNQAGDIYSNHFSAKAPDLSNLLISNTVTTEVVMGAISGKVYVEGSNTNNGVYDSGELALPGVQIQLTCLGGGTCTAGETYYTHTDLNGDYNFALGSVLILDSNLAPISFFVGLKSGNWQATEVTQPIGYDDGQESVGTTGGELLVNDQITNIPIAVGATSLSNNFGETEMSGIRGKVYLEGLATNDGIYNPGELGISNVEMRATCITGPTCTPNSYFTTYTDGNGDYAFVKNATNILDSTGQLMPSFPGLLSGEWQVREMLQPTQYDDGMETVGSTGGNALVNDQINNIPLPGSVTSTDNNFGELEFGGLSGKVYLEGTQTNNGVYDVGELGISNVLMRVTCIGGPSCVAFTHYYTYTDNNGDYAFVPGATGILDYDLNPITNFLGLASGFWKVDEYVQPPQYEDGQESIGTTGGQLYGTDSINMIPLPGRVISEQNNFGEVFLGGISGKVYLEGSLTNNGIYDSGEVGLQNIKIGATCVAGPTCVVGTTYYTFTDTNGDYQFIDGEADIFDTNLNVVADFTGLRSGNWMVFEPEQPANYLDGQESAGNLGGNTNTNEQINSIILPIGAIAIRYNFGEQLVPASLSGKVVWDKDDNSLISAGDIPLLNVLIEITCTSSNGGCTMGETYTVMTDVNGDYHFEAGATNIMDQDGYPITNFVGLYQGNWTVREYQPTGYTDKNDLIGSHGGNNSQNDIIDTIVLVGGDHAVNYNFLEMVYPVSIQGRVAYDANHNHLMESSDTSINNVRVTVVCIKKFVCVQGETYYTFTDISGNYAFIAGSTRILDSNQQPIANFSGLMPGVWKVVESQPAHYTDDADFIGYVNNVLNGRIFINDEISRIVLYSGENGLRYNFLESDGTTAIKLVNTHSSVLNSYYLIMIGIVTLLGVSTIMWLTYYKHR
ncbi:MAG TPA: hypothetical protein PK299_15640 [Anaerolineales bacterium]|nr:hypothetical protein [Anaerolineales bacterium]